MKKTLKVHLSLYPLCCFDKIIKILAYSSINKLHPQFSNTQSLHSLWDDSLTLFLLKCHTASFIPREKGILPHSSQGPAVKPCHSLQHLVSPDPGQAPHSCQPAANPTCSLSSREIFYTSDILPDGERLRLLT